MTPRPQRRPGGSPREVGVDIAIRNRVSSRRTRSAIAHSRCDSVITRVREAYGQVLYPQPPRAAARPAMEKDQRRTAPVSQNLDIPPGHSPPSRAKSFHHRFLAGEADREFRDTAAAVLDLSFRVYATEEPRAPTVQDPLNALNLDYVNTNTVHGPPIYLCQEYSTRETGGLPHHVGCTGRPQGAALRNVMSS